MLGISLSILGISSCQKINKTLNETGKYIPLLGKTISFLDLNEEGKRLAGELEEAVYHLTVNASANYGHYSDPLNQAVIFGGYTPNDLHLEVNEYQYSASENGGWYRAGDEFETFFNNDIQGKIYNNISANEFTFYAPDWIAFKKLGKENSITISKENNVLEWNSDPLNTTRKVVLSVHIYNNQELGNFNGLIYSDLLIIDDTGSYDISYLTSKSGAQRIEIELGRGNGASFIDKVNGNTFFSIKSSDYHEYIIK